jgi:hypothetical protein
MDDLIAELEALTYSFDGRERMRKILAKYKAALSSQWVSVSDRPPEKDVEVLVLNTNAEIQLDTWVDLYESPVSFSTKSICVGEGWESSDFEDVTHWCALPPIEQEQE